MPEPWLRNTLTAVDAIQRQVLHAIELTSEDAGRWCEPLSEPELNLKPFALPPIAFHMRHIVRSLDRLLTYAEDAQLSEVQLTQLRTEHDPVGRETVFAEFVAGLGLAAERIVLFDPRDFNAPRFVGRDRLQTTLGGLVVHCAEHTQRHAGQMVTTAKLVAALSRAEPVDN